MRGGLLGAVPGALLGTVVGAVLGGVLGAVRGAALSLVKWNDFLGKNISRLKGDGSAPGPLQPGQIPAPFFGPPEKSSAG